MSTNKSGKNICDFLDFDYLNTDICQTVNNNLGSWSDIGCF